MFLILANVISRGGDMLGFVVGWRRRKRRKHEQYLYGER